MQATIINAAPMANLLGTQDLSTRQLQRVAEATPQHCPKIYLYAQKGPLKAQLAVGDSRVSLYGADTFDLRKKFANHATLLSNLVNAEGNAAMYERIKPTDAGPESNLLLSLDVLPTNVVQYQRNTDGSFRTDIEGDKIPVTGQAGIAPGYTVKWVVTSLGTNVAAENFGKATITPGDQTDTVSLLQSQRYPIFQFKAASFGSYGNNGGIRLWAPTVKDDGSVKANVIAKEKAYPFRIAVIRRPDEKATPVIVPTQFSEQFITVVAKPGVIDPDTEKNIFIGNTFLDSYQNVSDPAFPAVFGDFGTMAIYENNIKTLVDMFYAAEFPLGYSENDFTGEADESYLFNFVGGTSSNGAPYNTFQFVTGGTGTVRLTEFSNIFAAGGSDGTMSNEAFATSVIARMQDYIDDTSSVQDIATNVESIIYDSGFPLQAKYALCNFIGKRKDTFVVLSTHTDGQPELTASEENSLAIALRTRAMMYPESDYFGTPVARAMIIGRSGKLRNSQYPRKVSAVMEIAIKAARYMGAGDGRWKSGFNFDGAPGSILDFLTDLNVTFTSAAARNKDWDVGLNYVQAYDRRSFFFPALKTVYSNDTSILNSFFTAMAICQINKVTVAAWREFSGQAYLTNAQLAERINTFISNKLENKFDGRYVIQPAAFFTDADLQRGYSITVPVKLFGPSMFTVMTTNVQAFRISDLGA
jgi:hypothetical protein